MNNNSLNNVGGVAAILAGVAFIGAGLAFFLDPTGEASSPQEFYTIFSAGPTIHLLFHWAFALAAIFLIAVVPAVSQLVRPANEGWVQWATSLAYIGFALTLIEHVRWAGIDLEWAAAFAKGDATAQTALIEAARLSGLDPQDVVLFGGPGFWFVVVSVLALREAIWPKALAYLGLASAVMYALVPVGTILDMELLIQIAAGLGGVVIVPIWLIWLGVWLRQGAADHPAHGQAAVAGVD